MCELVMFHANRRGEIMAGKIHLQSQDTVETMALPRCGIDLLWTKSIGYSMASGIQSPPATL